MKDKRLEAIAFLISAVKTLSKDESFKADFAAMGVPRSNPPEDKMMEILIIHAGTRALEILGVSVIDMMKAYTPPVPATQFENQDAEREISLLIDELFGKRH